LSPLFTKLQDTLGSVPDQPFINMDEELRRALTVGRPIGRRAPGRPGHERAAQRAVAGAQPRC